MLKKDEDLNISLIREYLDPFNDLLFKKLKHKETRLKIQKLYNVQ